MCIVRSVRTLLFVYVTIIITNAQWVIDDDGCRTPDLGRGECKNIQLCQPITDLIINAPKPLSNEIIRLLQSYQCGFEVNTVKVCCPDNPIVIPDSATPRITTEDITNHRNIGLLPQTVCGLLQTDDKILNGNVTALFEFPWMALISYRTDNGLDFRCGASLINDRYVLTAAHCITNLGRLQLAGVRIGEHDIGKINDCEDNPEGDTVCADPVQDFGIDEVIPHPNYNLTTYSNDIGLLRLSGRVNMTVDSVKPICLPIDSSIRNQELRRVIVTGWGRTVNESRSNLLLKVEIPIFPHEDCIREYMNTTTISNLQVCAGGRNRQDSCTGDSGGPMQVVGNINSDARYVQHGIVSFGPVPCGTVGRPGVYTKVAEYLDWILDNLKP